MDAPIGRPTPIHITKYDGSYHRRWPAWYVSRAGPMYTLTYRKGDIVHDTPDRPANAKPWTIQADGIVHLWEDRWYNVSRTKRGRRTWYYVNVATPVEFDGESFHTCDLDLDISWYLPDPPRVLDEDEFLANSTAMRYPADVIERARAAVDDVLGLIGERAFPFDRE